jgi:excisionase family DNA binding protein
MNINSESPLFTIKEAANYLRIGRSSLYRLIKSGHIGTVQLLPRKQLIEQKVLDQFVANPSFKNQEWNSNGK